MSKTMRVKLFERMKASPMTIEQVMEFNGKDRRQSQMLIHGMKFWGYPIESIDGVYHATGERPLKFYEEVYNKMACDDPREWWTVDELRGVFDKSTHQVKSAIERIKKQFCDVEHRMEHHANGSTSYYRLKE